MCSPSRVPAPEAHTGRWLVRLGADFDVDEDVLAPLGTHVQGFSGPGRDHLLVDCMALYCLLRRTRFPKGIHQ